jgi:hypothetical protein
MYKPGTQLIIDKLWAAAAAHELGFEVETEDYLDQWRKGFAFGFISINNFIPSKWRITVTAEGPNAAERFLPQVGDFIFNGECVKVVDDFNGLGVPGFIHPTCAAETLTVKGFRYDTGARRIIERNGAPFPQFSGVIEP